MAKIQDTAEPESPEEEVQKEKLRAKAGHVIKQVFKPKRIIEAEDAMGDWEVVGKRETFLVEKPEDSSDEVDDDDSY